MSKCCNVYNNSFLNDLKSDTPEVSMSLIRSRMQPYNSAISGIWMPLIFATSVGYESNLLIEAHPSPYVDPCNCNPSNSGGDCEYCYDAASDLTTLRNSKPDTYWYLTTQDGQILKQYSFDPCGNIPGNIDVRANQDDILPKIPVLDNSYITGNCDFKYFDEFPATQNESLVGCGLGISQFIKYKKDISLNSFTQHPELCIDWKIIERMGEIPFDGKITHHKDIDTHIKSYNKFLSVGKTCGNFIMLNTDIPVSGYKLLKSYKDSNSIPSALSNSGISCLDILPSDDEFTIPYGTKHPHYNNVFIGKDKVASCWKWTRDKTVLCWYRYSDINNMSDKRLINGVDLYISDGDIFWAKNDGPEKQKYEYGERKVCPLGGIKVVKDGKTDVLIPDQSEFLYISKNIYSKFLKILERLEKYHGSKYTHVERIELAAIRATGPSYDEITLDLIDSKRTSNIPILVSKTTFTEFDKNHIEQIETLLEGLNAGPSGWEDPTTWAEKSNYLGAYASRAGLIYDSYINNRANNQMLSKANDTMSQAMNIPNFTHQLSANNLNYITDMSSLVNTLASKYGAYLWIPSNTTSAIRLKSTNHYNTVFNLDFDLVSYRGIPKSSIKSKVCSLGGRSIVGYDQFFTVGDLNVSTAHRDYQAYNMSCSSGNFTTTNATKVYNLLYNTNTIGSKPIFTGSVTFQDKYLGPSYDLALSIDGEKLCSDFNICNDVLGKKYSKSQSNIFKFTDKSLYINRSYDGYVLNPNLDIVGFTDQGGMYCESNLFGKKTIFPQSDPELNNSNNNVISFGFKTYDAGIKLYGINIQKIRNKDNPECKTFPLDNPCNCEQIPIVENFPYNCDNKTLSNGGRGTPNLSTSRVSVLPYGGRDVADTSVPSLGDPKSPMSSVTKYIDPNNPYGCVKVKSVSLPYYTRSSWNLEIFPYDTTHGDLWVSISDGRNLISERVQTEVNVNGTQIFNNQFRNVRLNSDGTIPVSIKDPFLTSIIGDKQLYSPLCTSAKKINLTFKYIPRKHNLLFHHKTPQSMGTLRSIGYELNNGLVSSSNSNLAYDNKLYSFGFNDNNFDGGGSTPKRFYAPITAKLIEMVNNLDIFDTNKSLRLHIKINNKWHYVDLGKSFLYNNKYVGYPCFFEYQGSSDTKKLKSFIPSFPTERPNLIYFINSFKYKKIELSESYLPIFTEQFYSNKTFSNFINVDGFRSYFFVKGLDDNDRIKSGLDINDPLIPETFQIPSSLYIQNLNKNSVFRDGTDQMICTEPCLISVALRNKQQIIYAHITDKYLFKSSDGKFYTSFRLIPVYQKPTTNELGETSYELTKFSSLDIFNGQQGYIDFYNQKNIDDSTFILTSFTIGGVVDGLKNENDNRLSNKLYSHKWSDVYNFVNDVNTFDILNTFKFPKFDITYNNLYISIMKYMDNISRFKKTNVPFFLSASGYNGDNNTAISNYARVNLPSDTQYTTSIHKNNSSDLTYDSDYYLPFLDINYFSKNKSFLNSTIENNIKNSNSIINGSIIYSGLFLNKYISNSQSGFLLEGTNIINPYHNSGYFWVDLSSDVIKCLPSIFSSDFLDTDATISKPPYILYEIETVNKINPTNQSCTDVIYPSVDTSYTDSYHFSDNGGSISYLAEPYIKYPIYCDINRINGCNAECGMDSSYGEVLISPKYDVSNETNPATIFSDTFEYFITYNNNLYSNIDYIHRNELEATNNVLYRGISYDNDSLNNGVSPLPNIDISPYSKKIQDEIIKKNKQSNNVQNLDMLANEMLYRLFNDTKQFINIDTIGRKSQEQFYKKQKLASLKNILQNNTTVNPSKIYEIIPYDYDIKSDSSLRKINGNIDINGIINVGDTVSILFNTNSLNLKIEQNEDSIDLIATYGKTTKKLPLKIIKTISSQLLPIPANTTLVPQPNTTYSQVGSCTIYGGKGFYADTYFIDASIDGVDIKAEYLHCMDVITQGAAAGIYYCYSFAPITDALDLRPVDGAVIVSDYCSFTSPCVGCTSRGIAIQEDNTNVVAKSVHRIIPGARGTFSACIGCSTEYPGIIEGSEGGKLVQRSAPLVVDANNEGNIDTFAGGEGLRNPVVIGISNCNYVGCGPACLDINSTDKIGTSYFSYQIGYRTPPPGPPCQCIPYELGKCQKPVSKNCLDSCVSREYESINYSFKNGNYSFSLDGYKSRDKNINPPKLADQQETRWPDPTFLQFDWSPPPGNNASNKATEACVWRQSISPDSVWNIYEITTTNIANVNFDSCPETFANIRFTNKKLYVNEQLCFDIDLKNTCPNITITLPNNTYTFTNNITSECTMCAIDEKEIKLVNNENPVWETVTEKRNYILGSVLPIEGDYNYTLAPGNASNTEGGCCGPMPPPTCCGNRCLHFFGGTRQCGKNAPDSFPWLYCLECNIPGSPRPTLLQAQGGSSASSYINGGAVTNCVPFGFPAYSSPQIKSQVLAEWKRKKQLAFNDFKPCKNNKNILLDDLIEGVIPGSCELKFITMSFPFLAYRRTYDGSESSGGSLGVHIAIISYDYKRPKTIEDILTDEKCANYNIHTNSPPTDMPNIVEKYVNRGICGDQIICEDTPTTDCDKKNVCCRTNLLNGA